MRDRQTPKSVYKKVCLRSGGTWVDSRNICIGGHCEICCNRRMDWRGLSFAHLGHRKMGGTTSKTIHSAENIKRMCYVCHDLLDSRSK